MWSPCQGLNGSRVNKSLTTQILKDFGTPGQNPYYVDPPPASGDLQGVFPIFIYSRENKISHSQKTKKTNEGSHPGPSSNPPTKVDGCSGDSPPGAEQSSDTDESNLVVTVEEQLTGLSVRKKNRSDAERRRTRSAWPAKRSQGISVEAMAAETSSEVTAQAYSSGRCLTTPCCELSLL